MLHPPVRYYQTISSPVGPLRLIASEKGLCAVLFNGGRAQAVPQPGMLEQSHDHPILQRTQKQLAEYFARTRKEFDLPLDIKGTVFQIKAWRVLQSIPYGKTISYAQQAKQLGDVKKARAVGMANGRNQLTIIIPCHRVIGSSGKLMGFTGGMQIKEFLIEHEQQGLRKCS
jgi:methylated-DNA-[protein]-cysteine S-methyltransferase